MALLPNHDYVVRGVSLPGDDLSVAGQGRLPVSVVVPFRNSGPYIAQCAEGLLAQTFAREGYEIIMVDNGSSDASSEIVRQFAGIFLLSEAKQGAYAARNKAIRQARGEIIALTDADCVPSSDWLQELVTPMSEKEVMIALGSHGHEGKSMALSMLAAYENEKKSYVFGGGPAETLYGHANNMSVRKSLFEELGLFSEQPRGSDTAFVRLCADRRSTKAIRYAPLARVRHLEINSVTSFYRKLFIYGGSGVRHGHTVYASPLSMRQRLEIYGRTVRTQGYSGVQSAALLSLLAVGLGYWVGGSIAARWNHWCEENGKEQHNR